MSAFSLELRLLLKAPALWLFLGVFAILVAISAWQGRALAEQQAEAIAEARALDRATDAEALAKAETIRETGEEVVWYLNPMNAQAWSYELVRHVAMPPEPLAGAAIGAADLKPFLFRINPHPPDRWSNKTPELTPSIAAFGAFDLADVLLFLTPLMVLIVFADVIRERGGSERLRLSVVQSGSLARLLRTQLLARGAFAIASATLLASIGVAIAGSSWDAPVLNDSASIVLITAAYASFWVILLTVLIFAVRSASGIFAGGILLWFLSVVAAPLAVEQAARAAAPPPSSVEVFAAERAATVSARSVEEELTRDYASRDPLAAPMLLDALERDALLITPTNLLIQTETDRLRAAERAKEREENEAYLEQGSALANVSPYLLARGEIERLAGRDPARDREFARQVDQYHAELQRIFGPLLMRRATLDHVLIAPHFYFDEEDRAASEGSKR
ncbi:DUF3526 domain-containing protein [Erythrobacter sp. YT30]|uniref:DUF3526 domain-containing protein n=1 Tax=Erythrobacter sp. YT30 TaxID=1735012 RepID=UPI00076C4739|nr:DUF3526 domain-containing protein [Erythrobacter sp. YT30]KWV92015.1 hypothetical protein AUC45_12740 [Erythrobacter sp. YT30]